MIVSLSLLAVLVILMTVNQLLGTGYGSWKEGFNKDLFTSGLKKFGSLLLGYGALAFSAHFAGDYVPNAEYLSGILIEPIARYFSKICDSLRSLLNKPTRKEP